MFIWLWKVTPTSYQTFHLQFGVFFTIFPWRITSSEGGGEGGPCIKALERPGWSMLWCSICAESFPQMCLWKVRSVQNRDDSSYLPLGSPHLSHSFLLADCSVLAMHYFLTRALKFISYPASSPQSSASMGTSHGCTYRCLGVCCCCCGYLAIQQHPGFASVVESLEEQGRVTALECRPTWQLTHNNLNSLTSGPG